MRRPPPSTPLAAPAPCSLAEDPHPGLALREHRPEDRGQDHRLRRVHEPGARRGRGALREEEDTEEPGEDPAQGGQHHAHDEHGLVSRGGRRGRRPSYIMYMCAVSVELRTARLRPALPLALALRARAGRMTSGRVDAALSKGLASSLDYVLTYLYQ